MAQRLASRGEDFSAWYNEIVQKAELADYSPVRGCMVIRPYGYELWEAVKGGLDRRFKETGHENAYFPLFIPMSFLERESEHVEGFSPQLAVVTHGGGKELEEPLVVRPTSETIIGHMYAQWVQSYRDLPILINQWANVVRWELRTRLFLRTMEFLWQEGHTVHATYEEAEEETLSILGQYADFAANDAAIPVVVGRKSEAEKFPGALSSYSIEAMMGDRRALQAGTSHNLGQNFAKAFEVTYLDQNNEMQYCWGTSWGVSTRMVGAIIMVHGDDQGLRLPPVVAPIQVVIVPIFRDEDQKATVFEAAEKVAAQLSNFRVKVDWREGVTPGFKFNDWEMRGVPLRIELGPRDVESHQVVLARRDIPGKQGKLQVSQDGLASAVEKTLLDIHNNLFQRAKDFRDENTHHVETFEDFKETIEEKGGFIRVHWAGTSEDEDAIKEETRATIRCFPLDPHEGRGRCFFTGEETDRVAVFARAY